jgi:hypothetical protein
LISPRIRYFLLSVWVLWRRCIRYLLLLPYSCIVLYDLTSMTTYNPLVVVIIRITHRFLKWATRRFHGSRIFDHIKLWYKCHDIRYFVRIFGWNATHLACELRHKTLTAFSCRSLRKWLTLSSMTPSRRRGMCFVGLLQMLVFFIPYFTHYFLPIQLCDCDRTSGPEFEKSDLCHFRYSRHWNIVTTKL